MQLCSPYALHVSGFLAITEHCALLSRGAAAGATLTVATW